MVNCCLFKLGLACIWLFSFQRANFFHLNCILFNEFCQASFIPSRRSKSNKLLGFVKAFLIFFVALYLSVIISNYLRLLPKSQFCHSRSDSERESGSNCSPRSKIRRRRADLPMARPGKPYLR
jgi:hypothetical protein